MDLAQLLHVVVKLAGKLYYVKVFFFFENPKEITKNLLSPLVLSSMNVKVQNVMLAL